MKKSTIQILFIFFTSRIFAQPEMVNFYMGTGFQFEKVNISNGASSTPATAKCNHFLFAGRAMAKGQVFHVDMTGLTAIFLNGFKNPKRSIDGGIFDTGWGMMFAKKETSVWGWSTDLSFRQIAAKNIMADTVLLPDHTYGYVGIGGSINYLKVFMDKIFFMPKFSISYGGFSQGVNGRGAKIDVGFSLGYQIYKKLGISVNMGAYRIKSGDFVINPAYFQFGLAYLASR